jgi:hypothetical protein
MKEINKDIVKETSNRLLGLCENNPAAYKCMIELLSLIDVSIPVTVLDR